MAKSKKAKRAAVDIVDGGTEQTRQRLRGDPVDEMAAVWRRTRHPAAQEMENAAREIRRVYQANTRAVMAKIGNLTGIRGSAANAQSPDRLAIAYSDRYKPWADEMGRIGVLAVVIDWLHEEKPFQDIDRERRQRKGTAAKTIERALWQYCLMAGWVGRREDLR